MKFQPVQTDSNFLETELRNCSAIILFAIGKETFPRNVSILRVTTGFDLSQILLSHQL
jgi:hypothetical protein